MSPILKGGRENDLFSQEIFTPLEYDGQVYTPRYTHWSSPVGTEIPGVSPTQVAPLELNHH